MNYQWARSPELLVDPINKLIAGLAAALCLGSSISYLKEGERTTGGLLGAIGALQIWTVV